MNDIEQLKKLGHIAKYDNRGRLVTSVGTPIIKNSEGEYFVKTSKNNIFLFSDKGRFIKTDTSNDLVYGYHTRPVPRKAFDNPSVSSAISNDLDFVNRRAEIDLNYMIKDPLTLYITLSDDTKIPEALLDTIKANRDKYNSIRKIPISLEEAIGIPLLETRLGKYGSYSDWRDLNSKNNSFIEFGYINPSDLLNNHHYYISPFRSELNNIKDNPYPKQYRSYIYGHKDVYYTLDEETPEILFSNEENMKVRHKKLLNNKSEDLPWFNAFDYYINNNYGMGNDYKQKIMKAYNMELKNNKSFLNWLKKNK